MEKRRLGRTAHESTVMIFGAAALGEATQAEAEAAVLLVTYLTFTALQSRRTPQ